MAFRRTANNMAPNVLPFANLLTPGCRRPSRLSGGAAQNAVLNEVRLTPRKKSVFHQGSGRTQYLHYSYFVS